MNFFCNCHSGTALAYQCNLHCCLRTLPWFKHFRSHQSNLCTGQPNAFFAAPCCVARLLAKQKSCVLPHLPLTISSPATLLLFMKWKNVCWSDLCSWRTLPLLRLLSVEVTSAEVTGARCRSWVPRCAGAHREWGRRPFPSLSGGMNLVCVGSYKTVWWWWSSTPVQAAWPRICPMEETHT